MKKYLIVAMLALMSINASAVSHTSTIDDRLNLDLTIYNSNIAMIKDKRSPIEGVDAVILMDNISDQIKPETLSFLGGQVKEFNYSYNIATHESMLKSMVGQQITVQNEDLKYKAQLLSANGDRILVKRTSPDSGIVSLPKNDSDWVYYFDEIPDHLTSSPTLTIDAYNLDDSNIEVSYLTTGLSWNANYVASLIDSENLSLNAWVTINNQTSTNYQNANISVVAGSPNIQSPQPMREEGFRVSEMMSKSMADIEPDNVGDYKMYTIPFKTTLREKEKKQVALFNSPHVQYEKNYDHIIGNSNYSSVKPTKSKAKVFISMHNIEAKGLGKAIPAGSVRFYEKDANGKSQFIGENKISNLSKGEETKLFIGEAFDLTIQESIVSEVNVTRNILQRTYRLDVSNAKDTGEEVDLILPMNASMKIISSTIEHKEVPGKGYVFPVSLAGGSMVRLEFKVSYTYEK
jgi:hypothetical protein